MKPMHKLRMQIESESINEGYARVAISAFLAPMDPTLEELSDVKTAVSEAVTNCIVHGYRDSFGIIYITVGIFENGKVQIRIRDKGRGIADIAKAKEPLFTTLGGDRAGLGFSVMESFMDKVTVHSTVDKGTTVLLEKKIRGKQRANEK